MLTRLFILSLLLAPLGQALAVITKPTDAPNPLPPAESLKTVRLPDGFRLELVAAEPLIRQPSGVCWDAEGNLFVAELHGYNREQFDIEELNKTVNSTASSAASPPTRMRCAEAEQIGSVKKLIDDDGDGVMDRVETGGRHPSLPRHLPGARRDHRGVFAGHHFSRGPGRRRQGRGERDTVHRLQGQRDRAPDQSTAVGAGQLDLRRRRPGRADHRPQSLQTGEPAGDRFSHQAGRLRDRTDQRPHQHVRVHLQRRRRPVRDFHRHTGHTGRAVAMALPVAQRRHRRASLAPQRRQLQHHLPLQPAAPWRTKRADDPGFGKYYRDRYGSAESIPNGYFTSACSPLVYTDSALPGLQGQMLSCAPAQNFVHRSVIHRDGVVLNIRRPAGEEKSEFLTSSDIWFHPIHLTIGPEGAIYIADFYREIIEDYSAIPRYLQQQYGLDDGRNHGRVWRLVHDDMPEPQSPNLAKLNNASLGRELFSDRFWRRQTCPSAFDGTPRSQADRNRCHAWPSGPQTRRTPPGR